LCTRTRAHTHTHTNQTAHDDLLVFLFLWQTAPYPTTFSFCTTTPPSTSWLSQTSTFVQLSQLNGNSSGDDSNEIALYDSTFKSQ
jgi:hypothetical protein